MILKTKSDIKLYKWTILMKLNLSIVVSPILIEVDWRNPLFTITPIYLEDTVNFLKGLSVVSLILESLGTWQRQSSTLIDNTDNAGSLKLTAHVITVIANLVIWNWTLFLSHVPALPTSRTIFTGANSLHNLKIIL